ncbi:DNA alkylation repair protein [Flavobacterium urocaniciphilum]|uniref:DNA-7-methylguanine glycosylase n=1 Tax=Flavobacterium urocaniciphilum TaxID=1299341 RepID=A0A1H8Z5Z2_9FLAO|nr:DNA alkylation repair protein [Flavobacterium urocaniciphilum]SEP59879.1 DNA-7-methylguanine glycosylase [Flavobacterium urocaniciphilum]
MRFVTTIKKAFEANQDIIYGQKQSDYLKNNFPCYGIPTQNRREILKNCSVEYAEEIKIDFRTICWELYQFPHREMHQTAIDIFLKEIKKDFRIDDIAFIEKLILNHSWWDSVDTLAKYAVGGYLKKFPEKTYSIIDEFSNSENMWLNRTAIIFQLGYKSKTDFELLVSECEKHKHSKEFFIQKAIGWALREYGSVNPNAVLEYVKTANLKPLSKKEAIRKLI